MSFATTSPPSLSCMSGQLVPSQRPTPPVEVSQRDLPQTSWPQPPHDAAPFPAQSFPWRRYVDAVRRHRWLVLALVFAGIGAGWAASRFVSPQFETHLTIWIPAADRRADNTPGSSQRLLDAPGWADLVT